MKTVNIMSKITCLAKTSVNFLQFYQPSRNLSCSGTLYALSYLSKESSNALLPHTLGQCVDIGADKYASREAVVVRHQGIRKNFVEFKKDVDDLAAGFIALGLNKGDRLGMWSLNNYEWVTTQFAAAKAGLILVCVNPGYQQRELEYCLKKVGMRAIISADAFKTQNYSKMLNGAISSLDSSKAGNINDEKFPDLTHVIMISENQHRGTYNFKDVIKAGEEKHFKELKNLDKLIQFDDPVNIQFTSGTTGSPKGATLSHHNIVNCAYFFGRAHKLHEKVHRTIIPVPMYHCFGNVLGTMSSLIHGACSILPTPMFNPTATAQAIQDEKATIVLGTPTMFIDILNLNNFDDYNFTSLEAGCIAGAPTPPEILSQLMNKMNIPDLSGGYGCTETSSAIVQTNSSIDASISVLDHAEIKIVDEHGNIVEQGQTGEIWARGYQVMLGYWDDEQKTKESITPSRWYKTSDLGVLDDQGFIQIIGRTSDMIIRGGENIYPREIEDFLHTHDDVVDAQVVGVPDKRMGEEVCVWIHVKDGKKMTEDDVKTFCKGQLAHFKIPRYIMFVTSYPKTITGKVQKFEMRKQSIALFNLCESN